MKKLWMALAATLLLSVSAMAASTTDFSDFPEQGDWRYDALSAAVENKLLNGDNGKIMSDESMTRAQMAAILVRAFQGQTAADLSRFTDVSKDAWYFNELSKAVYMGIFQGDGNTMRPNDPISRQEAFLVLSRAFSMKAANTAVLSPYADAAQVSSWAKAGMAAMVETGYVKGHNNLLNPTGNITRAEFAVTMDRMLETYITQSGTVTTLTDGSVMINIPNVTLKDVTVKGNLIIGDGVGNGDVTLDSVNVEGNTVVRGGGVNSFVVKGNSTVGNIFVSKVDGNVRVAVEGNAKIEVVAINDGKDDVILEGSVGTLTVTSDAPVVLKNATVSTVNVQAENANLTVGAGSAVKTVAVTAPAAAVSVGDGAKIESVAATASATGVILSAEKGSAITQVVSAAPQTVVKNDGKITNVGLSKEATGSTYAVGKNADKGTKVTSENKTNLTVTTTAAYDAAQAAKAAAEAAAKAETERLAAAEALKNAADEAAKAEAEAALKAAEAAADAAKQEAASTETTAKQETEAAKDTVSKVEETVKEDTVEAPTVDDDGTVDVPTVPTKPEVPSGGGGGGSTPSLPAIEGLKFEVKDSTGNALYVDNTVAKQATLDLTSVDKTARISSGKITTTTTGISGLKYTYGSYSVSVGPECSFLELLGIIQYTPTQSDVSVAALNILLNEWYKQSQSLDADPKITMPSDVTIAQSDDGKANIATVSGTLSANGYNGTQSYTLILKCKAP